MMTSISSKAVSGLEPEKVEEAQKAERKASVQREKRMQNAREKRQRALDRAQAAFDLARSRAKSAFEAEELAATNEWHEAAEKFFG